LNSREPAGNQLVLPEIESRSLVIHGQGVCAYAKCSYCPLFSSGKTRSFDKREFEQYIEAEARRFTPEEITSVFISEGNSIGLEIKLLQGMLKTLYKHFPFLKGVSVYGSALSVLKRRPDAFSELRKRGLTRIHMGLESGSDAVLKLLNKGIDQAGMIDAAGKIKKAGIELFLYVLVGAGGRSLSGEHVDGTSEAINLIEPHSIQLQTLIPIPQTPLFVEEQRGNFKPLSPHDSIREIGSLMKKINVPVEINCSHITNYCQTSGRLPEDHERLQREIDYALSLDESLFDTSSWKPPCTPLLKGTPSPRTGCARITGIGGE